MVSSQIPDGASPLGDAIRRSDFWGSPFLAVALDPTPTHVHGLWVAGAVQFKEKSGVASKGFLSELDPNEVILVCTHSVETPSSMLLVRNSADGTISCTCEQDHSIDEMRWLHASHVEEVFPNTQRLPGVPRNHVAMFFADYEHGWVVEEMLHGDEIDDQTVEDDWPEINDGCRGEEN